MFTSCGLTAPLLQFVSSFSKDFQEVFKGYFNFHGFPFIPNSRLEAVDVVGAVRLCELVAGREGAEVD